MCLAPCAWPHVPGPMCLALYTTDLSDGEWAMLRPLLPPAKPGGRPRSSDLRMILNAIFYVLRSGCPWRLLPRDFPPWSTVYDYFRTWRIAGIGERLNAALREQVRPLAGRQPTPSAAIIDSQSVKTTERGGPRGLGATMEPRNGPGASAICSSTRPAYCCGWSSIRPTCRIGREPNWWWRE